MKFKHIYHLIMIAIILQVLNSCNITKKSARDENKSVPASYSNSLDSTNGATINWRQYFTDPFLIAIIDTALKNNQELNILLQEMEIR